MKRSTLLTTDQPVRQVYFPHSGVISLLVLLSDGETIETAMIGRDSDLGGGAALDSGISVCTAVVQIPGMDSAIDVAQLRRIADQTASLRQILAEHEKALLAQAQQSAACNVTHALEQRLARWLLRARGLTDSNSLPFTHEFLAEMLGVRRSSVSVVANPLQREGLIRYRRGLIEITDLDGLRRRACECYEAIDSRYRRLVGQSSTVSMP